ncbi:MAG: hypothetical protein M5U01_04210 [Ardenticatenaceae bacterium]|nr:hypothetical protein [Ardenticatenaceae bacterium]HBY95046.1 DUF2283 domain-containing protein [Chloroflexota bacterium]
MGTSRTFKYDREADTLHVNTRPPYPGQATGEVGDEVIARLHRARGEFENLGGLFFSTRRVRSDLFELPVTVALHPTAEQ